MKTVKQPIDSNHCVIACLAMVADLSFEHSLAEIMEISKSIRTERNKSAIVTLELLNTFLARHGWTLGFSANFQPLLQLSEVDSETQLSVEFRLDDCDALLTVGQSESDLRHLVCWDSSVRKVRDPHWNAPNTNGLHEVKISQWYPLIPTSQTGWL